MALIQQFPDALIDGMKFEIARAPDVNSEIAVLTPLLRHCMMVLNEVEKHFAHGSRYELSEALADEIRHELTELHLSNYNVVLSHGAANNFETLHGDIAGYLFQALAGSGVIGPPPANFAIFRVPRLEGAGVQWRPALLGHEVAHVAVREYDAVSKFDLAAKFDGGAAAKLSVPGARPGQEARVLFTIASNWATELICDAHAARRFGPAAVAALAEYFTYIGAMEKPSTTHPPGLLRIQLIVTHLGPATASRLSAIAEPWIDVATKTGASFEPWVQFLSQLFTTHASHMFSIVGGWPAPAYNATTRTTEILAMADRFAKGMPGREVVLSGGRLSVAERADAINGAWVARVEEADAPFDRLALKTIESIDFISRWLADGGSVPSEPHALTDDVAGVLDAEHDAAVLNASRIVERLRLDDAAHGLVVTPLLHMPSGVGLDLRLGSRFIVFKRTGTASFDPLDVDDDPRSLQMYMEVSHAQTFVLHPQEIVLGASLEYLALPLDLSGQVITRSSYGRLGLLTATAIQIQPGFRGCLTLELANLSTIPITLTPGERIAQLVLSRTEPASASPQKYDCPIGPEFSRVRDDPEARILRDLRR